MLSLSEAMLKKQKKRLEKSREAKKIIYDKQNKLKSAADILKELQQEFNIKQGGWLWEQQIVL